MAWPSSCAPVHAVKPDGFVKLGPDCRALTAWLLVLGLILVQAV